jgi:hypothetical protein
MLTLVKRQRQKFSEFKHDRFIAGFQFDRPRGRQHLAPNFWLHFDGVQVVWHPLSTSAFRAISGLMGSVNLNLSLSS